MSAQTSIQKIETYAEAFRMNTESVVGRVEITNIQGRAERKTWVLPYSAKEIGLLQKAIEIELQQLPSAKARAQVLARHYASGGMLQKALETMQGSSSTNVRERVPTEEFQAAVAAYRNYINWFNFTWDKVSLDCLAEIEKEITQKYCKINPSAPDCLAVKAPKKAGVSIRQ